MARKGKVTRRSDVQVNKMTKRIRRISVTLRLAKRRYEKDKKRILSEQLSEAATREEFHDAQGMARLLTGRGPGARRRVLGALPASRLHTEERAQTPAATNPVNFAQEVEKMSQQCDPVVVYQSAMILRTRD